MSKIRLFLVDDHKMIRDALEAYISEDDRFEVVNHANHGEEALQRIKENPDFDILLTDIVMPQVDGIQLVLSCDCWLVACGCCVLFGCCWLIGFLAGWLAVSA